jgi:hypothetical protein
MARELSIPPDEVARQQMRMAVGRNAAKLELESTATEHHEPEVTEEGGPGPVEHGKQ